MHLPKNNKISQVAFFFLFCFSSSLLLVRLVLLSFFLLFTSMGVEQVGTVCVTGAAGFIGSWLVMKLLERGYTVKATVRDPSFVSFLTVSF